MNDSRDFSCNHLKNIFEPWTCFAWLLIPHCCHLNQSSLVRIITETAASRTIWNCSEKMWNFCMLDKSGQQLYFGMFVYIYSGSWCANKIRLMSPWACCFHAARLADLSSFQRPVGRENIQPSQELRLTQERFNSAGSPPQPATVLYTLSNEGQLLLVGTLVRTLYVLFLLRWRVELWKKRQTWSRIPPESFQQAIKYTLVTMETGWCGRH